MAQENDIVLIYYEDNPMTFARIEDIKADHKPDWYHVKLLLLQIPLQPVTWILKNDYINGDEFSMDGKRVRLELILCPQESFGSVENFHNSQENDKKPIREKGPAQVISLNSRRNSLGKTN